jgi:hypothetical protein
MPENWRAWARRYLGNANAKPTLANQEKVARAKMKSLFRWLGSWRRVSYWWLTGSSRTSAWSRAATSYVARVMAIFGGPDRGEVARSDTHRYSERSSTIDYAGTWRSARHGGYAGGSVRYATAAGATATFTFTGRRVAWYGPVGPTRGKARVRIDGVAVKTVNLKRSSFDPTTVLYSASWKTSGAHTLEIEVLATPGHRLVAIAEIVVTNSRRPPWRRIDTSPGCDDLDLDPEVARESGHADGRARRRLAREVLAVDPVHGVEVGEVT